MWKANSEFDQKGPPNLHNIRHIRLPWRLLRVATSAPMATVLTVLAEGFEELEAIAPIDLLRRANISVTVAALNESPCVIGRTGIALQPETTLAAALQHNYDLIVLPGGPGVCHLRANPRIRELVLRQQARGGLPLVFSLTRNSKADARNGEWSYPIYLAHWIAISLSTPLKRFITESETPYAIKTVTLILSYMAIQFDTHIQMRFKRRIIHA